MLTLRLMSTPVFNVDNDISKIRTAVRAGEAVPANKVAPLPCLRCYLVTADFEPMAIFDRIGAQQIGGLLKLALCFSSGHIDNPRGYRDLEIMNTLRPAVTSGGFKKPYRVAVLCADRVLFHFSIPVDLGLVLCERLAEFDIVDRGIWEGLYDAGGL